VDGSYEGCAGLAVRRGIWEVRSLGEWSLCIYYPNFFVRVERAARREAEKSLPLTPDPGVRDVVEKRQSSELRYGPGRTIWTWRCCGGGNV
jgi:hypothetical protein